MHTVIAGNVLFLWLAQKGRGVKQPQIFWGAVSRPPRFAGLTLLRPRLPVARLRS